MGPKSSFDAAGSSLLIPLFDGAPEQLREVARTAVSVHYETPPTCQAVGVSWHPHRLTTLCVCAPTAVRLPNALVTRRLPPHEGGWVGEGELRVGTTTWRVTRWWVPPRPRDLLAPPARVTAEATARLRAALEGRFALLSWGVPPLPASYDGLDPAALLGAGPGLTPAGDDVLAGALVAAHATNDPRLARWQRTLRALLIGGRTTAVSRGMLGCALDGYATPELADFVHAACGGPIGRLDGATDRLLGVGHSSGPALVAGVLHTLTTTRLREAA